MLQNLERGRGLLCRTLMKSQLASTEFSATFAALVAIINTKLPEVGELLLKRVVWQVGLKAAASTNAGALCLHAYHKAAASHVTKALLAGLPCSSGGCGSWGWRQMQIHCLPALHRIAMRPVRQGESLSHCDLGTASTHHCLSNTQAAGRPSSPAHLFRCNIGCYQTSYSMPSSCVLPPLCEE